MYYSLYNPLLTPAIVVIRSKLVVNYVSAIFLNIFLSFFFFFFNFLWSLPEQIALIAETEILAKEPSTSH